MSLTRRQIRVLIVAGFVIGLIAIPALGAILDNSAPVSGGVPIVAPDGPALTVDGDTNISLDDPSAVFPDQNTVTVYSENGNITASSTGDSNLTVDAGQFTGTWTNVTEIDASVNALTVDPEDKSKITLDGAATDADWTDYEPDDGTPDLVITGPDGTSTNVTFYGLEANTEYTALNQSTGTPAAIASSDSNGDVTFTIDHSTTTILLQEGASTNAPTQANATPTGNLDTEPSEVSVDVDDADFPDDEVDVTIDLDGTEIHSSTITSASTITETIPADGLTGGEHTWTVNTTDRYGNTRIEQYTYAVPDTLYIRNESNASQLVDDPINVTVRFIANEETPIDERISDTGTVDLTGLSVGETFVVTINASDQYHSRTIYFQEGDIYEQQDAYLLNTTYSSIETRFVLDDPTGSFDETSVLSISKPINQSGSLEYETIHGDQFGVEGVTATLESDRRYRIKISSADGSTVQDLGPYRSDTSETVTVNPSAPGVEFDQEFDVWGYGAELDNTSLQWSYYDNADKTESLTIYIHERGDPDNQLVPNETYLNLGNASGQYTLTINESEMTWVVKFIVDRGDGDETYETAVSNRPDILPNMDEGWMHVAGAGMLIMLAGAFSVLNVGVGAVVFGVAAGVLWFVGVLNGLTTGAAIVIYLLVAVGVYISRGERV